jgi:hypothetical protein
MRIRDVHGEFQNAEEINDCTGEHLRDVRAQFATFMVRISRPRGSKWKSDTSANRILECVVAAGSEFVVTGDEHGAGRC